MSRFHKLGEREVWRGSVVWAGVGRHVAPDGTEFERDVVHHPGAVSVVPVLDGGRAVLLVRQYRSAVDRELLEIPAGKRDVDGEAPEVTAGRELEEELGMRAGRLQKLAEFYNSPGFCDEHSHVYMGRDLEPCLGVGAGGGGAAHDHRAGGHGRRGRADLGRRHRRRQDDHRALPRPPGPVPGLRPAFE